MINTVLLLLLYLMYRTKRLSYLKNYDIVLIEYFILYRTISYLFFISYYIVKYFYLLFSKYVNIFAKYVILIF